MPRSRSLTRLCVTVLLLLAVGCGRAALPTLAVEPGALRAAELLEAARSSTRYQGYDEVQVDAARGRLWFTPHHGGGAIRIELQLYQDGWIRVVPQGPRMRPNHAGQFAVDDALRREVVAYVARLEADVTPGVETLSEREEAPP